MKFNTTYKPQADFKKTIQEIANIKKTINQYMNQKWKLISVIPPALSEEGDEINIDFDIRTRTIAFESKEKKILKLFLSHSNWVREMLRRMNLKINQGIFFESSTIWRDLEENAVSTITKQELTYAFCIKPETMEEQLLNITNDIYQLIYKMAAKIKEQYKIANIYPQTPNFITSQQLENEMPSLSFADRENEFIIGKQAFFLTEVGTILFSGKKHSEIPIQIYDLKNFNQIIMFDRNNSAPLKVVSIAILANGRQLSSQLALDGHGEMASLPLYQSNINDNRKFIEIKINLSRLAMALLAKGHIGEVQAGITSNEAETIKNRYGIDIY